MASNPRTFLVLWIFLVKACNGEAPASNYMFSNYDSAMYPKNQDHHHEIHVNTDLGSHSTGDDYGYTDLSPDNPFKGPATSMTHSYSPPSIHFGGGVGRPYGSRAHGTMNLPERLHRHHPHKSPQGTSWNPFKSNKNKGRGGPYPPSPPPQASVYGHTPSQPESDYGHSGVPDPFAPGHGLDGVPRFPVDNYGIKPNYVSPYSTLPNVKGTPPSANSIFSYYPTKTLARPSTSPLPPTTSATFELSTQGYHHAPVRTPAPPPTRGYGQQFSKGHPFAFSFRKPNKHNGKTGYQKISLNYKGYMPPPPPPAGTNKRPYGYTPTSYDGTGLATADYRRRLLLEPFQPYPAAEIGYGGGYDLGTSHY